ncbi:MAG: hypothetical protein P4L36_16860 [Holophaga sp.]|nr:hypothetical protein [Holophaga sp.]
MSYTTVIRIWPGERIELGEELHNSWGSAPVIWNAMAMKYLGAGDCAYFGCLDRLWPLWKHLGIPEHQRAVLMMTYDRAYVVKADYARAAKDIRASVADFSTEGRVNHWLRLAEIFESDPDVPAIGLHCTSVSENPFEGPWDEEKEDYDPPDWSQCFSVYAEIDGLTRPRT